ncbi:Pycsar system effector family protein [Kitasatospora griseola]|uniref:Pycsar system effector family protein n=1 Tax=Kitasatospora griseola TaxID=2064 RepID=UPI00380B2285
MTITETSTVSDDTAADRTDQNLTEALTHTAQDLARTDQKVSVLLGLDGVLAAAVAILAQAPSARLAVITPAAALLLAATILAVLAVRPRMDVRDPGDEDRSSPAYWSALDPEQLRAALRADRRLHRLTDLSTICDRKMALLRWAADTSIAALVALAAAALITAA